MRCACFGAPASQLLCAPRPLSSVARCQCVAQEAERWDCESILSLTSNLENHPAKIVEPQRRTGGRGGGLIRLSAKTGMPVAMRGGGGVVGATIPEEGEEGEEATARQAEEEEEDEEGDSDSEGEDGVPGGAGCGVGCSVGPGRIPDALGRCTTVLAEPDYLRTRSTGTNIRNGAGILFNASAVQVAVFWTRRC